MKRDNRGRFIKGVSGNPAGQPTRAAELRRLLEGQSEIVAATVLKAASEGDMTAARLVLERLLPPVRPAHQPVRFTLDSDAPLSDQGREILGAIAAGEIPPDQGKALLDALASLVRVTEIDEIERRLKAIEEASNEA